ncbi:hypothetical protein CSOJ01_00233 [Colletotrichum sojae]|uniref:Uncharacterized protein n=1 Tax=Colletotrichum sojae TaxID=2175907 RepID=A0A8H6JY30_9PEZI|nr:hypothetical protein CSOJ01_00233 [Colletotrichum sojae]
MLTRGQFFQLTSPGSHVPFLQPPYMESVLSPITTLSTRTNA